MKPDRTALARLRRLLAAAAVGLSAAATAAEPAWQAELDALVRMGHDHPDTALSMLQSRPLPAGQPGAARAWRAVQGVIEARDGRETAALASAEALDARARDAADPMARGDAELIRAVLRDGQGRTAAAAEHAQAALDAYDRLCGRLVPVPRSDCDHRARWRAMQVLAVSLGAQGLGSERRRLWQAAADLSRAHQDLYREAWSLGVLASATAGEGELEEAGREIAQALRVARASGAVDVLARVKMNESAVLELRGDAAGARRAVDEALRLAQSARSPRLEALILTNLTDVLVKAGHPREALQAAERALPVVRRHRDRRLERTLLHNASLARLGLKQVPQARKDFDQMMAVWEASGEGDQSVVLREFSDALAAAGDHAGALQLYHRERQLAEELKARNRQAALRELQTRYDREVQQRHIELLERDNAVKGAQIENRALLQRVWTLLAVTLAVAAAFAVLLYLRVRETQRQLERSHATLQVQSQRDPLTGLANRRHFQDVMRSVDAHRAFEGALMLVDIDHFKHVNDSRGHAAGDEVLLEVARRIQDSVRSDDLVVRWGGEEFLVYAPGLEGDSLAALAERLLQRVGGSEVTAQGQPLRVTASLGYGHFPLPPARVPLSWERALNFVDMALYTAKSLGRNRAVGVVSAAAADATTLLAMEEDFESAWSDGHLGLRVSDGPAPPRPRAPA